MSRARAERKFREDLEKELDQYLDLVADRVFEKSQRKLLDEDKVDTAALLKTANINRQFLKKEIVYPAPHAEPVHFGRMAGTMPPVEPLEKWARRKGFDNPKSSAWAIAKAIKKRGIQETPFLADAAKEVEVNPP